MAIVEPDEIIPPQEDEKVLTKAQIRMAKRIRKAKIKKMMGRITTRKKKAANKRGKGVVLGCETIRTSYEHIFESYCKLLDMPYEINCVWCFSCNNYYRYNDSSSLPKACQICNTQFYSRSSRQMGIGQMARPDIILDYNDPELSAEYRSDGICRRRDKLAKYAPQYRKKLAVIRIDGGIHDKQRQRIKDFHQYHRFRECDVKVFIVRNEDIDRMIGVNDNGKTLLKFIHTIGEAVIDDSKYTTYTQDKDFQERIRRPF